MLLFFLRLLQAVSGSFTQFTQSAPKRMLTEALESAAWSTIPWLPRAKILPWPHLMTKVIAPGDRLAMKSQRSLRILEQIITVVLISCTSIWIATSGGRWGRMSCLPTGWNPVSWTHSMKRREWWLWWGCWWGCCWPSWLLSPSYWCWDPDRRMGRKDGGRKYRRWWKAPSVQSPCWWWGCKTATTARRSEQWIDGQMDKWMWGLLYNLGFFFKTGI